MVARDPLLAAIDRRTDDRIASLRAKLAARQDDEQRRIVTSAERFRARGYVRRSLRNLSILFLYAMRVPAQVLAKLYG